MNNSYQWTITPTGIKSGGDKEMITRLRYTLSAFDNNGGRGDLGEEQVVYLPKPIPLEPITPQALVRLLTDTLGPTIIALYKSYADDNLSSFVGETITVEG